MTQYTAAIADLNDFFNTPLTDTSIGFRDYHDDNTETADIVCAFDGLRPAQLALFAHYGFLITDQTITWTADALDMMTHLFIALRDEYDSDRTALWSAFDMSGDDDLDVCVGIPHMGIDALREYAASLPTE